MNYQVSEPQVQGPVKHYQSTTSTPTNRDGNLVNIGYFQDEFWKYYSGPKVPGSKGCSTTKQQERMIDYFCSYNARLNSSWFHTLYDDIDSCFNNNVDAFNEFNETSHAIAKANMNWKEKYPFTDTVAYNCMVKALEACNAKIGFCYWDLTNITYNDCVKDN